MAIGISPASSKAAMRQLAERYPAGHLSQPASDEGRTGTIFQAQTEVLPYPININRATLPSEPGTDAQNTVRR
jgi:hypothetical protein